MVVTFVRSIGIAGGLVAIACGGLSAKTQPEESDAAGAGQSPDDACTCPADRPTQGAACACEGLACAILRTGFECQGGKMVCNEGAWQRVDPPNERCPGAIEEIDGNDFCSGVGRCRYEIDVGCGPDIIEFSCECVDTAWYLSPYPTGRPPLCDCGTITTQRVCAAYPRECAWSYDDGRCKPLE